MLKITQDPDPGLDPKLSEKSDPDPGSDTKLCKVGSGIGSEKNHSGSTTLLIARSLTRVADPRCLSKRGGEKIFCITFFCNHKVHKI